MAKSLKSQTQLPPASAPEPIIRAEPETLFEIRVNRVVSAFGEKFRPMHTYTVKQRVLDALGDAVASSESAPFPPG